MSGIFAFSAHSVILFPRFLLTQHVHQVLTDEQLGLFMFYRSLFTMQKRKFLTPQEVSLLLSAALEGSNPERNHCLIMMAFLHGFRATEILWLCPGRQWRTIWDTRTSATRYKLHRPGLGEYGRVIRRGKEGNRMTQNVNQKLTVL